MSLLDHEQENVANWIAGSIRNVAPSRDAMLHLRGLPGTGKTTVMRLVANRLRTTGPLPVYIPSTLADSDSGAIALAEAADALSSAQFLNGEAQVIRDPHITLDAKVSALKDAIDRHHKEIVVLCDEPTSWYATQDTLLDDMPQSSARRLAEWFARDTKCRRIVSGALPEASISFAESDPPSLSYLASNWSPTFSATYSNCEAELLEYLHGPHTKLTPLKLKIGLALTNFLTPSEIAQRLHFGKPVEPLLHELLDSFERNPSFHPLCRALSRVAVVRTGVGPQLFEQLVGVLSDGHRHIVEHLLCDNRNNTLALNLAVHREVVRRFRNPRRWEMSNPWRLATESLRNVHSAVASEYASYSESTLRNDVESLYHDLLREPERLPSNDPRLHCVEQLQAIGRALSYQQRDHENAAKVFSFALRVAPADPYNHHYLAFNLDWLATDEVKVEHHYQEALRLRSSHPWYWSRWVSYLATRGQSARARTEWERANDALSPSEESPLWLFQALHRWVARWLLHWGDLDFAENVLSAIPDDIANSDVSIRTLKNRLTALRTAECGTSVFPLSVPFIEWWSPMPHTDLPSVWEGQPLRSWIPARIDAIDTAQGEAYITTGERPITNEAQPIYRDRTLTRGEVENSAHNWIWADLSEGRYIEFAEYGVDGVLRIGLHRETEWRDPHLLPLVPPPDRWYRRAVQQAWDSMEEGE